MKHNFLPVFLLGSLLCGGWVVAEATPVKISNMVEIPVIKSVESGQTVDNVNVSASILNIECEPGLYSLSLPSWGSLEFEVKEPEAYSAGCLEFTLGTTYLRTTWTHETDFTIDMTDFYVCSQDGTPRVSVPKIETNGIRILSQKGDTYAVTFVPTDLHPEYLPYTASAVTNTNSNSTSFQFAIGKEFTLTFPEDAIAELSFKKSSTHYIAFKQVEPVSSVTENGKTINTYLIPNTSTQYAYKVRRGNDLTHGELFAANNKNEAEVTDEQLKRYTRRYFNHDIKGNGTNYADIFLNINKRHLLRLKKDQTFQIVNVRTWQVTNNATANLFIEPDYNWTVLNTDFKPDNSVVEIGPTGLLTAKAPGTAIVQVRYDGISFGAMGGSLWSEIWAENTGTFVVTVDADEAAAPADNIYLSYKPNDTLDAEHDILYYMADKPGYELTFTPASGSSVTVANPLVDTTGNNVTYPSGFTSENVRTNPDGSVTVLLTFGRNIIRTSDAAGNANYQVLSAKPVTCRLKTQRTDTILLPGDNATAQFEGLFHVAGKMAGIYNHSCYIKFDGNTSGTSTLGVGQYDFAGNEKAQRYPLNTANAQDNRLTISNGCLYPKGFGSVIGGHRAINYTTGVNPNFNAGIVAGDFGSIPTQTFEVTPISTGLELSAAVNVNETVTPVNKLELEKVFGTDYTWTSADPETATVDQNGVITGIKAGKTTVIFRPNSATRTSSETITTDVIVSTVPVTGLSLPVVAAFHIASNGSATSRTVKATLTPSNATDKRITWSIDDPAVASVDQNGVITPLAPGKTLLRAIALDGNIEASPVEILVYQTPASIAINPQETVIPLGSTLRLNVVPDPANANINTVSWTSSDPEIATVDTQGEIVPLSTGEVDITATAVAFNRASFKSVAKIRVTDAITGIDEVTDDVAAFWPNPCTGTLYIESAEEADVLILSLDGTPVFETTLCQGTNALDLSAISSGIYLIRIGKTTSKLIRR